MPLTTFRSPIPILLTLCVSSWVSDLWVFRDSNWSPDFPTAARLALELYRPTDLAVPPELSGIDGVIAIDQRGVQMLLDGLGPLWVAGVSEPVTGETVLDYIHAAWAPDDGSLDREWWAQRKSFMGDLASAAMVQLRSGQVDLSALGQSAYAALAERHIQVYFKDAAAAASACQDGLGRQLGGARWRLPRPCGSKCGL